jgi:hypothetical protein
MILLRKECLSTALQSWMSSIFPFADAEIIHKSALM